MCEKKIFTNHYVRKTGKQRRTRTRMDEGKMIVPNIEIQEVTLKKPSINIGNKMSAFKGK